MTETNMTVSLPTQAQKSARTSPEARRKVLVLASHVVPYGSAGFRLLAQDPRLDIQVAYCSMQGAERGLDQNLSGRFNGMNPCSRVFPGSTC
jgi:hypothetical protein